MENKQGRENGQSKEERKFSEQDDTEMCVCTDTNM